MCKPNNKKKKQEEKQKAIGTSPGSLARWQRPLEYLGKS
jgi:hypothetical protein